MFRQLTRLGLACVVVLSLSGLALAHEHEYRGATSAIQYGYHNGYVDGFQHGREDRAAGVGYHFKSRDYHDAMSGYESYMGSKHQYRIGYRQGYMVGYNDGFHGRNAQVLGLSYEPLYRGDGSGYGLRSPYGPRSVAFQIGYRDGLIDGRKDRRKNKKFRPTKHDRYEDADHGYSHDYGSKREYKREYREGYLAGYERGYGDLQGAWNR